VEQVIKCKRSRGNKINIKCRSLGGAVYTSVMGANPEIRMDVVRSEDAEFSTSA